MSLVITYTDTYKWKHLALMFCCFLWVFFGCLFLFFENKLLDSLHKNKGTEFSRVESLYYIYDLGLISI